MAQIYNLFSSSRKHNGFEILWIMNISLTKLFICRCYDKNGYPDHDDEFIVPVSSTSLSQGPNKPLNLDPASLAAVDFVINEYNRREVDSDDGYYKLVKVHESSSTVSYYFIF